MDASTHTTHIRLYLCHIENLKVNVYVILIQEGLKILKLISCRVTGYTHILKN